MRSGRPTPQRSKFPVLKPPQGFPAKFSPLAHDLVLLYRLSTRQSSPLPDRMHITRARARATHSTTRSKHANPLPHTQFGAHTDKGFHTTVRPVPRLSQLNACSHVPQALALTHTPTALVKRKSSNTKTRDAFSTYAVILMPTVDALLWGRVF